MNDIAAATWEALAPLGFTPEQRPDTDGVPGMPADVTDLSEQDVMILYNAYSEWANYAASQLSDAWDKEKQAQFELENALADAAVLAKTEKTVAAQKAVAAADPIARDAARRVLYAGSLRRKLEAVYGNTERRAQVLSRELSRRIARTDRVARSNRWGGA